MPDLYCKECQTVKKEDEQIEFYNHSYCKRCYKYLKQLKRLTNIINPIVSVEGVGLDWQLDSIKGKALEIMKKNNIALNSDEALFLLYLKQFDNHLIIREPTEKDFDKLLSDLYGVLTKSNVIEGIIEFLNSLIVNYKDLTSFQTIRLARQELKREAKRKGMIQLFDPVVEEMRKEREETIKERYLEELF